MKKIVALIISCAMMLMCASTAFASTFQTISGSLEVYDEQSFDGSIQLGTDDDGCTVIYVNNEMDDSQLIVQIGSEGIVYGEKNNLTEIYYSDLIGAIESSSDEVDEIELPMEEMLSSGILQYFGSEEFQNDMQALSEALSAELTQILLLANQEGLVTADDDGTITIEFDTESLIKYIALVLSDLSQNDEAFDAITSTSLWQMFGIEGGKEAIQQSLAELAEEIKNLSADDIDGDINCKCVIAASGDVSYSIAATSGEVYEKLEMQSDENGMNMTVEAGDGEQSYKMNFSAGDKGISISGTIVENGEELVFNGTYDSESYELVGDITQQGQTINIVGALDDSSADEIKYVIAGECDGSSVFNITLGMKAVSNDDGAQAYKLYADVDGMTYALYLGSSTDEEGSQYLVKLTLTAGEETLNVLNLNVYVGEEEIEAKHLTSTAE